MLTFNDIHTRYDTDKGTYHSYVDIYDRIFPKYKNEQFNMCEIGVLTGGSLKMFEQYFTNATIYGVDSWEQSTNEIITGFSNNMYSINTLFNDINLNHSRIKLITCNSTNSHHVNQVFRNQKFKIIIDDGDHRAGAQFLTYKNFIKLLDDDGIYIIEDVGDWDLLPKILEDYHSEKNLDYTMQTLKLFRNGRSDDAMIIITKKDIGLVI